MTPVLVAAAWIAYIVVPAHVGGLVQGVPLGPVETWALAGVIWLTVRGRSIGGARIVAAATVVTLALGAAVPADRGFRARYFADAEARGPIEPSTEYRSATVTRVDARLDFSPRSMEFPLAFFNDIARFNFTGPAQPDRQRLAFSASWDGQWHVDSARTGTLYLDAPAASAELVLDGARVAAVAPGQGVATTTLPLTPGWHRLDIRFSSPYSAPRRFSTGELVGERQVPFDAGDVLTRRLDGWQLWLARAIRAGRAVFDLLALAWLALLVILDLNDLGQRRRPDGHSMTLRQQTLAVFGVVVMIEAYLFASPFLTRLVLLAAGDDPITYESYARSIQLNGVLLRTVEGPYYYQVFYPYFLAGTHWLFGESMFGVVFVQRLLLAFIVWMVVEIAVDIAGERVWPAAFGCAAFVVYIKFAHLVAGPSTEALFIPLLVAWTAAVVRLSRDPTRRRAVAAGLLGGVAALTRSTAIVAWMAGVPALWIAWRGRPGRRAWTATLVGCSLAVVALIAVRNAIVAHEFAPLPTEFPVTLLGGNEPPPTVQLDFARRGPLYDRIGLNSLTRQVVEYAVSAPGPFAGNLGRKALFALGFYEPYAPGSGRSIVFIAVWLAALAGLVIVVRTRASPLPVVWLPAFVALSQFAAVVLVYPKHERLILPFYILLLPYAAVTIDRVAGLVDGWSVRRFGSLVMSLSKNEVSSKGLRYGRGLGIALVSAMIAYTFAIRTRGITDHFLMLTEQMRDWSIALGPISRLPLVGTESTAGGHSLGPVFYWVLWLIRVVAGPFADNLPHAGGVGLAALQSIADGVLCIGIRRASGSWTFALAAVLIVASSPFDLALSSVIWNPVLAVALAKIGTGLVLGWQGSLTRQKRLALAAIAWLTVQAHTAGLAFASAVMVWILWTQLRLGLRPLLAAAAEIALVVTILQVPALFAAQSVRPTKVVASIQHPEPPHVATAFGAVTAAVESIGFAPFTIPQATLLLLGAAATLIVTYGAFSPVPFVTIAPFVLAVLMGAVWQGTYDAYVFLSVVPAALLMILWTLRCPTEPRSRALCTLALLVFAVAVQKPRIASSADAFRMPGYGAIVRGSRAVVQRGQPVRRIDVPFLHPLSDSEYVFTLLGGRIQSDAADVARISESGEVTYVR